MNRKRRIFIKMNIISLFFIALSFVSITLAWFAYSGLGKVETDINVKAWYIEFQKDNQPITNDIVISLDDIYPGMEPTSENIAIKNMGDSDAQVSYEITSARILDEELSIDDDLLDKLSHDYPFHINVGLTSRLAVREVGDSELNVSVSWPLDSDTDELDSKWGTDAFKFKKREEEKKKNDPSYQIRSPLRITLNMKAEQFTEDEMSLDSRFNLGDTILFDPINKEKCSKLSDTCIKMYVIDADNKNSDKQVTLMPDLYKSYGPVTYQGRNDFLVNLTANWQVLTDELSLNQVLNIISLDVVGTTISRESLSDSILGQMSSINRINQEISKVKMYNGYFNFVNERFKYLVVNGCYWLKDEYDDERAFTVNKENDVQSKVMGMDKMSSCQVVPIIKVDKEYLTN